MEGIMDQLIKKKVSTYELKYKQSWINQLIDAFTMEESDSYI